MSCCSYERHGLLETITTLPSTGWYYGNLTISEAERLLRDEPNGAFIVRDSSDSDSSTDLFTITFKIQNKFGSVRVDYAKGYFSLSLADPGLPLFRTVMDLITFCQHRSVTLKLPVCVLTGHKQHQDVHLFLTKPVSRFRRMHSLMYYCRQAVLSMVTLDKLEELGLPRRMVELYLSHNPLFDEQLMPEEEVEADRVSQSSGASEVELATGGN